MKIKFNKSKKICLKSINEYRSTFVKKKFRHLVFFDRIGKKKNIEQYRWN